MDELPEGDMQALHETCEDIPYKGIEFRVSHYGKKTGVIIEAEWLESLSSYLAKAGLKQIDSGACKYKCLGFTHEFVPLEDGLNKETTDLWAVFEDKKSRGPVAIGEWYQAQMA